MSGIYKVIMIISFITAGSDFLNDAEQNENYNPEDIFSPRQTELPENIKEYLDGLAEKAVKIKSRGFGFHSFRLATDDFIAPETLLVLRRYYQDNNTLLQNVIRIPDKLAGLSLKELKEISFPWELKEYNPGKLLILYRAFEKTGRMRIGEKDGRVAIFYGEEDEELTGIKVNELPAEEQNSIRNGLSVNSLEELLSVLDGFISSISKD